MTSPESLLHPETTLTVDVLAILHEIGFADHEAAFYRFQQICDSDEARKELTSCLPMLLHALSLAATPDGSLINFERFVQTVDDRTELFRYLSHNPRAVEILIKLFVGSQFLTEILLNNPSYLRELTQHKRLAEFKSQQQFYIEALSATEDSETVSEKISAVRRYQRWELLRLGACDSFGLMDLKTVTVQLSLLADSTVQVCLKLFADDLNLILDGFCVLAFGKLGGEELNYSSDIDLVFVAEGNASQYWSLGQKLIKALMESSGDGFLYRVDMRLRPWGRSGALVTSYESYLDYLQKNAMLWEKQALLKARTIAGDFAMGKRLLAEVHQHLFDCDPQEIRESVRSMKEKIESSLDKKGKMWGEVKAGIGSIRDVEFVTQYLQLTHGLQKPGVRSINTLDALVRLADLSIIHADEYRHLSEGYVFLRTVEHALQLMHYKQIHSLPTNDRELAYLARRLDFPDSEVFLTYYDRHSANIRRVFDRYIHQSEPNRSDLLPAAQTLTDRLTLQEPTYANLFTNDQIALHTRLLKKITDEHLVELHYVSGENGLWELTFVGEDRVGTLSITAGLLFVYGFNIVSGNVFTGNASSDLSKPRSEKKKSSRKPRRPDRRYISVLQLKSSRTGNGSEIWADYERDLQTLLSMLQQGKNSQAQGELARRVAIALSDVSDPSERLVQIDIQFDNEQSDDYTLLNIRADDTPGFLYELANGLSSNGILIHRVVILSEHNQVADTLYVTDSDGRKILEDARMNELRVAIVLIKHFTHLLPSSPNPQSALIHFRQFLEQLFTQENWTEELAKLEESRVLKALAQLLGVSDFLWEDFIRMQHTNLFPVLTDIESLEVPGSQESIQNDLQQELDCCETKSDKIAAINAFKDREMLRADLRHILGYEQGFGQFSRELTAVAEVTVNAAIDVCLEELHARYGVPKMSNGDDCGYCVCALGKCGGYELGFASDIELMFLYQENGKTEAANSISNSEFFLKLVEQFQQTIQAKRAGIFEIDLRLRPYGRAGSLAVSLDAFSHYFKQGGAAWPYERQALVKLRAIGGHPEFGQRIIDLRDELVYVGKPFDVAAMRGMREKQIRQLVKPGTINAKLSRGGLVDVEYLVQGLQISYGHRDPSLRVTNTREALKSLARLRIISEKTRLEIRDCYRFLRRLIDALRMVRGNAHDLTVPALDSEEFEFLTRRMGESEPKLLREEIETIMLKTLEFQHLWDDIGQPGI